MEKLKTKPAQVVLPCSDIDGSVSFYTNELNFRLDSIFPADNPRIAVLSGYGLNIRLEYSKRDNWTEKIRLHIPGPQSLDLVSPDGVRIEFTGHEQALEIPKPEQGVLISKFKKKKADWIKGRAGMRYRDLIPDRLGGFMIASQIHISDPGPVPDYVHFHDIRFQLIFCLDGSAKLVYEDQGEPFLFEKGDCVLQPPGIRHRVLETSGDFDVVEVSCPAEHETHLDHQLELPNLVIDQNRLYGGQEFVLSRAADAAWQVDEDGNLEKRDLQIREASGKIVDGGILRLAGRAVDRIERRADQMVFAFVIAGRASLLLNETLTSLRAGDCFVLPPGSAFLLEECTDDLQILEVSIYEDLACS